MGRGDFLLVVKGEVTRFQAAYVSEREVAEMVDKLRRGERKSRRPEWLEPRDEGEAGERLRKTGTGGERVVAAKRPVVARVVQQLRLIK